MISKQEKRKERLKEGQEEKTIIQDKRKNKRKNEIDGEKIENGAKTEGEKRKERKQ